MIRRKTWLDVKQATALITAINENQMHDLLPFLRVMEAVEKTSFGSYRLCIDCPSDSQPRIANKLKDSLGVSFTWYEYDMEEPQNMKPLQVVVKEKPVEQTGMTAEYKAFVEDK